MYSMLVSETVKVSAVAVVLMYGITGCASTPPSVQTNERPSILDHPSVLDVADHDAETTTKQFLEAMEHERTFGYCLPVGSPRVGSRPIACFITELGDVYVVLDHSQEEKPYSLYEIGPAVRKSQTRYYLPLVDAEIDFGED
jgi:hypothetical protein